MSNDRAEYESADVETQFDPRHPLIFQRGYDPDAAGAAAPVPAPARPSTRLFSGRERAAGHERPFDHLIDHSVDHRVAPLTGPVAAPEQQAGGQPEEWAGDVHNRNPFITALWIVGIGLIVTAVSFQWWVFSQSNTGYSGTVMPIELVLQQLSWSISTPMISTGMLTIVGLVVWKALRWQEREGSASVRVPLGDGNE